MVGLLDGMMGVSAPEQQQSGLSPAPAQVPPGVAPNPMPGGAPPMNVMAMANQMAAMQAELVQIRQEMAMMREQALNFSMTVNRDDEGKISGASLVQARR